MLGLVISLTGHVLYIILFSLSNNYMRSMALFIFYRENLNNLPKTTLSRRTRIWNQVHLSLRPRIFTTTIIITSAKKLKEEKFYKFRNE